MVVGRFEPLAVRVLDGVRETEVWLGGSAGLEVTRRGDRGTEELAGHCVVPCEEGEHERTVEVLGPSLPEPTPEQRDGVTGLLVLAQEREVVPLIEIVREIGRAAVPRVVLRQVIKALLLGEHAGGGKGLRSRAGLARRAVLGRGANRGHRSSFSVVREGPFDASGGLGTPVSGAAWGTIFDVCRRYPDGRAGVPHNPCLVARLMLFDVDFALVVLVVLVDHGGVVEGAVS